MTVSSIRPEQKDYDRANAMKIPSDASKMAKLITDVTKLVRRSKAVAAVWSVRQNGVMFAPMINPFEAALKAKGFDASDIESIRNFRSPDSVVEPVRRQIQATQQDDFEDKVSDKW